MILVAQAKYPEVLVRKAVSLWKRDFGALALDYDYMNVIWMVVQGYIKFVWF